MDHLQADGEGFLWLGGEPGLLQFDGVKFKPIALNGALTSLSSSPDGWVYIATTEGLWRGRNRVLEKLKSGFFAHVCGLPGGVFYTLHTRSVGLWRANISVEEKVTRLPGIMTIAPNGDVILPLGQDIYQITASDLARNKLVLTQIPGSHSTNEAGWTWAARDSSGAVWMRSESLLVSLPPAGGAQQLHSTSVYFTRGGSQQKDGSIWFSFFLPRGIRRTAFAQAGKLQFGNLPDGSTLITHGADGTMWLINNDKLAYSPMQNQVRTYSPAELPDKAATLHPVRLANDLYTPGPSGIFKWDPKADAFRQVAKLHENLPFAIAAEDHLIASSLDNFLIDFRPSVGIKHLPAPPRPPDTRGGVALQFDAKGNLHVSYGAGILRLDANFNPVESIPMPKRRTPVDILFDPAGRMWAAAREELAVRENGTWKSIGPTEGLNRAGVNSIAWHEGALWFGQPFNDDKFGRVLASGKTWRVEMFGKETGHWGFGARSMRVDSRGWLWRGTIDRGFLVCATRCSDPLQWIELNQRDGLPNPRIAQSSWWEDKTTNQLWWVSSVGLSRMPADPQLFARNPNPLLWLDPPVQNGTSWRFRWGSLYFQHPSAVQLRYRLSPGDGEWKYLPVSDNPGGETQINNLPWGHHEFQIQARVGREQWYPTVASAAFDVPFPYTSQLRIGGGIGATLGLGFLWGFLSRRATRTRFERIKVESVKARALSPEEREAHFASLPAPIAAEVRAILEQAEAGLPDVHQPNPPADFSGLTLGGRYLIEKRVGEGGFATLYRAFDLRLNNRPTAIKILDVTISQSWNNTIDHELAVLASLRLHGVVAVFDRGLTPWQQPFLALEFIEGKTLRQLLSHPIEGKDRLRWMGQLAAILDSLHAAGIVHRDLKPENLMVRDSQDRELVVIDLGIATIRRGNRQSQWATQAAGSLNYMAPEQLYGLASSAADIYAYALIILECTTGRVLAEYAAQHEMSIPDAARQLLGPSPSTEPLVRALAYMPEQRPRSATALWRAWNNSQVGDDASGLAE